MLTPSRIQYAKKPGKMALVKVVKDQAVRRDDIYKSGEIRTGPGENPSSVSRPTPKGKRIPGKPITSGKLLRPGGPSGGPSKLAHRPAQPVAPVSRPLPGSTAGPRAVPMAQQRPTSQAATMPKPAPQAYSIPMTQNHARNDSTQSAASARVAPPPPPLPPAAKAAEDTYRAIYDFNGQTETELSLQKDEVVVITQKADNGKFKSCWLEERLTVSRLVACETTTRCTTRLGSFCISRALRQQACTTSTATSTTSSPSSTSTTYRERTQ